VTTGERVVRPVPGACQSGNAIGRQPKKGFYVPRLWSGRGRTATEMLIRGALISLTRMGNRWNAFGRTFNPIELNGLDTQSPLRSHRSYTRSGCPCPHHSWRSPAEQLCNPLTSPHGFPIFVAQTPRLEIPRISFWQRDKIFRPFATFPVIPVSAAVREFINLCKAHPSRDLLGKTNCK
jgi:hypothetical protein